MYKMNNNERVINIVRTAIGAIEAGDYEIAQDMLFSVIEIMIPAQKIIKPNPDLLLH